MDAKNNGLAAEHIRAAIKALEAGAEAVDHPDPRLFVEHALYKLDEALQALDPDHVGWAAPCDGHSGDTFDIVRMEPASAG